METISYEPIIKDMTWSYSRVKAFDMCPYMWYLKYIQNLPGKEMFFSSYGSFVHKILEMFYKGELAKGQLLYYYLTEFRNYVVARAPNPKIFSKYFQDGVEYFKRFAPLQYENPSIEQKVSGDICGIKFTGIIDYKAEDDQGVVILDNKSRTLQQRSGKKNPTKADEELDKYFQQLYLYSYIVETADNMPVSKLGFNCFRCNPSLIVETYSQEKANDAVSWFVDSVSRITQETDFKPDMDYFKCANLCDMHDHCEYYQLMWGK